MIDRDKQKSDDGADTVKDTEPMETEPEVQCIYMYMYTSFATVYVWPSLSLISLINVTSKQDYS